MSRYKHNTYLHQRGSGRMNPTFVKELSKLSFVVNGTVLGDDIHAIIMSLVEEFNSIAENDLKHNLELSQFYSVEKNILGGETQQYDNCEIVLKYLDKSICIGKMEKLRTTEKGTEMKTQKHVDCTVSRGLVKFFIKHKNGDLYKYTPICVVKVEVVQTVHPFLDTLYQNNEEINKIEEESNIAVNVSQSEIIQQHAKKGSLEQTTPSELQKSVKTVNDILENVTKASAKVQLDTFAKKETVSDVPSKTSVNAAYVVAKTISETNIPKETKSLVIMVPHENIPLREASVKEVGATIKQGTGTTVGTTKGINTLSGKTPERASVQVDATLAIVPEADINESQYIQVIDKVKEDFFKSLDNFRNKLWKREKELSILTPKTAEERKIPSVSSSVKTPSTTETGVMAAKSLGKKIEEKVSKILPSKKPSERSLKSLSIRPSERSSKPLSIRPSEGATRTLKNPVSPTLSEIPKSVGTLKNPVSPTSSEIPKSVGTLKNPVSPTSSEIPKSVGRFKNPVSPTSSEIPKSVGTVSPTSSMSGPSKRSAQKELVTTEISIGPETEGPTTTEGSAHSATSTARVSPHSTISPTSTIGKK